MIIKAEPVFQTIKWAGVAYLVYLGVTALRAAWRAKDEGIDLNGKKRRPWMAFQSGFICNITNPKVLMFNVAVLPQFVGSGAGLPELHLRPHTDRARRSLPARARHDRHPGSERAVAQASSAFD
nr:LysE family translocator [Yimella sp. cx-51]